MGNRNFREDMLSMLEFEVGFRGKFILEQQCKRMDMTVDDIDHQNISALVENIHRALTVTMGAGRAEAAYRWLIEYARAIETIYRFQHVNMRKTKALIVLGDKRFQLGRFDGALKAYRLARRASMVPKKHDPWLECRIRRKLARALSQSRSGFVVAKTEYNKVIALGTQINDDYDVSLSYLGLGILARQEEDADLALEYFDKAYGHMKNLGSGSRDDKERGMKAECQINMALADLHLEIRDTDRSIDYTEQAIDTLMEMENFLGVGMLFHKMRTLYRHKREYERLLSEQKAVPFNRASDSQKLMEGWTRMNLASILMESGNYSQAEEHLSKAYEIISRFDYPEAHSKLHIAYGNLYLRKNALEDSEAHYIQSMGMLPGDDNGEYFARAQEGLGTLYLQKGENDKGAELLRSAMAWHESNQNASEAKRINRILADMDGHCPVGIAML